METLDIPEFVKEWCDSHRPLCRGCKFCGNQCVTPDGQHNYAGWQQKMFYLIEAEIAKKSNQTITSR